MSSSSNDSPVLITSSPPPPHVLTNPELTGSALLPSLASRASPEMSQQQTQSGTAAQQLDESSSSDSGSSDRSTETARTASTPRSDPILVTEQTSSPLGQQTADQSTIAHTEETAGNPNVEVSGNETIEPGVGTNEGVTEQRLDNGVPAQPEQEAERTIPPPPPPPVEVEPHRQRDDVPDWVKHDEDTSTPDEKELKEIEARGAELNATDIPAVERTVFTNIDDPDLRPSKRIRLSWVIQGVRGSRSKPNRARIITSPAFFSDGYYWNIKFFPRGNKSRNSLAAFVRCSRKPLPDTDLNKLPGTFTCYEGTAEDSELKEMLNMTVEVPKKEEKKQTTEQPETPASSETVSNTNEEQTSTQEAPEGSAEAQNVDETQTPTEHAEEPATNNEEPPRQEIERVEQNLDDDSSSSADDDDDAPIDRAQAEKDDFRVSAQLGMVAYNPEEPRTCYTVSSEHQFCPHEDDWGWDSLVSRWDEIHRRKHGQRQALLRNDTLALDAYIRIYDDPTKALFWHSSSTEREWDSKLLAGYFPMGTRLLYHSPAVAGITAWSLLAPFRDLIQSTPAGEWRHTSNAKPRPLLANLQLMLFQMRHMRKDESYIHLDNVICEIMAPGESFEDVKTFWEVFRRSLELELEGDEKSIARLAEIFGPSSGLGIPLLPVKNAADIQQGLSQVLENTASDQTFPDFMPLILDRQSFDMATREWKLHHDRVHLNDEIDLSRWTKSDDATFTLYGFVVHDGERNSGKFYSILRPEGPGGKWLAFSDGNGNKVFSYTRKSLVEYEGLEGAELKSFNSTRQTAYMAMYIRKSRLQAYLPGPLEPYKLPAWLVPFIEEAHEGRSEVYDNSGEPENTNQVKVEVFWDESIIDHKGTVNMYNMKTGLKSQNPSYHQIFTADSDATLLQVQQKIASVLDLEESAINLWNFNYHKLALYSKVYMHTPDPRVSLSKIVEPGQVLCLWLGIFVEYQRPDHEKLQTQFLKLEGIHVEKPPTPAADAQKGDAPAEDTATGNEADSSSSAAASSNEQVASTNVPEQSDESLPTQSAQIDDEATAAVTATPDLEQASVQQAVMSTVQSIEPATPVLATEPADNTDSVAENVATTTETELHVTNPTDASDDTSNAVTAGNVEEHSQDETTPAETGQEEEENEPLVVHGHLFEAASHEAEPVVVDVIVPALGDFQTAAIQASLTQIPGDISAEDAALIASMMAADLAAAEIAQQRGNPDGDDASSRIQEEDIISRPATPLAERGDIYGFVQVFDAEEQTIVTKMPFLALYSDLVSDVVRKQLKYQEDRQFTIWRREGPYDTTVIPSDASFRSQGLQDGCDIIVGEVMSESKMDELKAKGDFYDPGQLIRYIIMTRHRHPILSCSTTEPIELTEFGGDYFKGNLVRGRRHGDECRIITATGEVYDGPMVADQKSGSKGKMVYHNGDTYTGDWLNDERHGQGEFMEKRTGNRYVGGYENDKRWGKGVTYWEQADEQADLCQICYFEDIDALFYECGHVCACYNCAKECPCCPICRKTVRAVVRMYRS